MAIQYLLDHNIFADHRLQQQRPHHRPGNPDFVDNAATMGLPEAGAMARLLGGTATDLADRTSQHLLRRAARPARRPPAAVQLLRLRGRRPAQRRDHDRPVQDAGAHPAAQARRSTWSSTVSGRRPTASCSTRPRNATSRDLQHILPTLPVRSQGRALEVPQHHARPLRRRPASPAASIIPLAVPGLDPVQRGRHPIEHRDPQGNADAHPDPDTDPTPTLSQVQTQPPTTPPVTSTTPSSSGTAAATASRSATGGNDHGQQRRFLEFGTTAGTRTTTRATATRMVRRHLSRTWRRRSPTSSRSP